MHPRVLLTICATLTFVTLGTAQTLSARDARYHLRPGDVITVSYRYTPEYNATVAVEPDGFASLPLLGDIKLGGLALPQVHDALVAEAAKRFNDPEITVELKEFDKPHYIVGGEVGTPGRYDIHGHVTALQAIEMAGGFKISGKCNQVLLIRPVNDKVAETKVIDLKKITKDRRPMEDLELKDGDMLIVPRTRIASVEPYIRIVDAGIYLIPMAF